MHWERTEFSMRTVAIRLQAGFLLVTVRVYQQTCDPSWFGLIKDWAAFVAHTHFEDGLVIPRQEIREIEVEFKSTSGGSLKWTRRAPDVTIAILHSIRRPVYSTHLGQSTRSEHGSTSGL
jgi:hypothetical protein